MNINSVEPGGYLYSITDAFPAEILEQIYATPWLELPYTRLEIGRGRRRLINLSNLPFGDAVNKLTRTQWIPSIEAACGKKFKSKEFFSTDWWVDEPGFKPHMHTDGDKPAAIQIYLLPLNVEDLGTSFFHSNNYQNVFHEFRSVSNTGYLMFNQHQHNGSRKMLWHDMTRAVPESVTRVCFYLSLPPYELTN